MPKQRPRRIVMFAFEGAQLLDVTGPLQILAAVNDEHPKGEPAYEIVIAAREKGELKTSSGIKLVADVSYIQPPKEFFANIDTMLVSGGDGTVEAVRDKDLIAAIRNTAKKSRRVASVCTGAFLLATAGLLENKRATTHWASAHLLAKLYPGTTVDPDAIFVRDGKVWTSAGVTAGMDLALAMVREDFGDEMALKIARRHVMFVMRPGGQSQFSAHLETEAYPRSRLASLLRWIPENISGDLDIAALAARAHMSERSFARIFRKETGETPAHYVERMRLDGARRLLAGSTLPVASVASRAGFGSEERMRRVFQRHLKISPSDFRERFRAQGEAS
ncbi:MAG TPA: GlxA family transcriptional regulator [Rhizomicrobium sp.]|nr:GlxA family transcriptional regulator [Rhizomicrobium sp.]